ncbi:unnamed protein product, partial [Brassica napus]
KKKEPITIIGPGLHKQIRHLTWPKSYHMLMGEEKCEESDEECMKRRMITESHLD